MALGLTLGEPPRASGSRASRRTGSYRGKAQRRDGKPREDTRDREPPCAQDLRGCFHWLEDTALPWTLLPKPQREQVATSSGVFVLRG